MTGGVELQSLDEMPSEFIPSSAIPVQEFLDHVEKFDASRQLLFQQEFEVSSWLWLVIIKYDSTPYVAVPSRNWRHIFNCIAAFEVLFRWTFIKGGADTRFVDSLDIHMSMKHVWAPPLTIRHFNCSNAIKIRDRKSLISARAATYVCIGDGLSKWPKSLQNAITKSLFKSLTISLCVIDCCSGSLTILLGTPLMPVMTHSMMTKTDTATSLHVSPSHSFHPFSSCVPSVPLAPHFIP